MLFRSDKQIRPTTEGKGFSYNGFPLYHKLTESDANQIIDLCQPQWVSEELQTIVDEIKRSIGDFKFQLLVEDLEGIINRLPSPPTE